MYFFDALLALLNIEDPDVGHISLHLLGIVPLETRIWGSSGPWQDLLCQNYETPIKSKNSVLECFKPGKIWARSQADTKGPAQTLKKCFHVFLWKRIICEAEPQFADFLVFSCDCDCFFTYLWIVHGVARPPRWSRP